MPKRTRPPGLADGTEFQLEAASPKAPSKAKSSARSAPKGSRSTSSKGNKKISEKDKAAPKSVQARLKVGVDYGTTNSGVAYMMAVNLDAQDVKVITEWFSGNEQLEKVPSRIALQSENANLKEDKWGYEVPPDARSYSWTKLLLDSNAETTKFDSSELTGKMKSGILELPEDMTAEQVVTTYLSKLYKHMMNELEREYTANILRATPMDVWLTVPATWQESAVYATRKAAENAGFGSRKGDELSIITEPEAAAIAILSHAVECNPNLIKVQRNVLICDLGGGTLDFQLLTITSISPQLETEETIPGLGGKSGGTYIDCNLHKWLEASFGNAFTKLPSEKTGPGSKFMNDWEVVKKSFTGRDLNKKHNIYLPALGKALQNQGRTSASYDMDDNSVVVTGSEIADMFEPVIDKAFELIGELSVRLAEEGRAGFEMMCLCGGLGSSVYVWERFREYVREHLDGRCQIFKDNRAWSAVVRGAAIRGVRGSVVLVKRSKRAYGIAIHRAFEKGKDKEEDAFQCPIKGKRAPGYLLWSIKVTDLSPGGLRFQPNMRIKTSLYVTIDANAEEEDLIFRWKLFSCALESPPEREEHQAVKPEGNITLDLSHMHKRLKNNDGSHDSHQAVEVSIVFKMGNERGVLVVEALQGKKVVGTARIDYSRTHARRIDSQSAGLLD